jgi:ribose 5-phosphate isomerase B
MKKTSHKKTILIASDHAGFELKKKLVAYVKEMPFDLEDMGAHTLTPDDDYPVIMTPLAMKVATDPEHLIGIVIGGSGNGEAMLCNRFPGVRAAVYYGGGYLQEDDERDNKSSLDIVRLAREHNDANVLSLGARFVSDEEAMAAVRLFLETPFSGEERHVRRIAQIDAIE